MIVDVFSTLDASHPAHGPGDARYLVAPPAGERSTFPSRAAPLPRVLGGLFPVSGVPDEGDLDPWWKGLLLRPHEGLRLNSPGLLAALRSGARAQLPLVIECGREEFSRPDHLQKFLENGPQRPIVLTHGAQLNICGADLAPARDLFVSFPHTFLETSGIYRQDFLEDMFRTLGPRRIFYGSGHPYMAESLEIERVNLLPATESEKAQMLGRGAAEIFGL